MPGLSAVLLTFSF